MRAEPPACLPLFMCNTSTIMNGCGKGRGTPIITNGYSPFLLVNLHLRCKTTSSWRF